MTLLLTIIRGLRSRALLSAGSVLLTALAIGSAVLGPVFSSAVTNSFLISRLDETPNAFTGLSWRFTPEAGTTPDHVAAEKAAAAAANKETTGTAAALFGTPQTILQTKRVAAYGGQTELAAKEGECDHLEITGRCPEKPGEVMLLAFDLEFTGTKIGDTLDLGELGKVTVVGSYRTPDQKDADFWFNPNRLTSAPPRAIGTGSTPYLPAPWLTVPAAFDTLPQRDWTVQVDRQLDVPRDLQLSDLTTAQAVAATLKAPAKVVDAGQLEGDSINEINDIVKEARGQQDTARKSIAPAVISLVLVALALLLRLLMAAADLRMPELALASLRGLSRRRMWQLGLAEPLTLLGISTPVGVVLGVVGSLALLKVWLVPGLPLPTPLSAVLAGVLVVLGTLFVAVLAVGLVLRVTLAEQLTGVRRPRRSGRIAVVVQLVLVAAAVAVLASKLTGGAPGDPDVTDLVLPVLLAVVAGLAASRVTSSAAGWWTRRRPRSRSLPAFVAARAISRRAEGTLVILPVTAAIAVCVFGAGVYDSAAQWRASVASTIAPAPVLWQSSLPLSETVAVTHQIDPDGRYLMAGTTMVTQGPSYAVLDTSRLSRVANWPKQWTPGISTDQIADLLSLKATVPTISGGSISMTVDRETDQQEPPVELELRLGAPDGQVRSIFLGPYAHGTSTASSDVPFCAKGGCSLQSITIGGAAAVPVAISGSLTISQITSDGKPVPGAVQGAGWTAAPDASAGDAISGVTTTADAIKVDVDSPDKAVVVQVAAGALPGALPVVAGVDARLTQAGGAVQASSTDFAVDPVVRARSVPLLGPIGLMIDYTTVSTDRLLFDQQAPVYVFARSDTPQQMQDQLRDRGATLSTTLHEQQRTLDQSAYALALRLYAVVAALVLLMALAGLFVSTAVQLPSRRRDAASLRVVGVPRRAVMSAVLRELAFVLGGTAVAGLAAGTLAQYVVLRTVRLGYVTDLTTPRLVAAIDPTRLAVLAVLAAVLFGAIALASSALTVRGARGATLRENAR